MQSQWKQYPRLQLHDLHAVDKLPGECLSQDIHNRLRKARGYRHADQTTDTKRHMILIAD